MHLPARLRSLTTLALVLSLTLSTLANDNPKKGRVTTNPQAGS